MSNNLCAQWEDYYDGALSSGENAVFETHLSRCPDCQRRLEQLAQLESDLWAIGKHREVLGIKMAAALSNKGAPLSLQFAESKHEPSHLAIAQPTASRNERQTRNASAWRLWLAIAALVMICLGGAWLVRSNRDPDRSTHASADLPQVERKADSANTSPEIKAAGPKVICEIAPPAITGKRVTSPNFTFVHVYPSFVRVSPNRDSDREQGIEDLQIFN